MTRQELRESFIEALKGRDKQAIITALASGDVEVKSMCLEVLTDMAADDEEAVDVINNYITYGYSTTGLTSQSVLSSWIVRDQAAKAAGQMKSETSIKELVSVIQQEQNQAVILSAIKALGDIGSNKATSPLLTYLMITRSPAIANEIVIALGNIGDSNALSALMDIVQQDKYSMKIKSNAVEAIKKLKAPEEEEEETSNTETTAQ